MKLDASKVKKILVISLSNIGDVILTFPVLDVLKRDFPKSELSVVVGPKAAGLFEENSVFKKVFIYDKHQPIKELLRWLRKLRQEKYDLVVDLRNTAIPFLLRAAFRTPLDFPWADNSVHMKQKHLNRLKSVYPFTNESRERFSIAAGKDEERIIGRLLNGYVNKGERFAVVGPGAANHIKRWRDDGFSEVCDKLIRDLKLKVVFVGDVLDGEFVEEILRQMKEKPLNICGKTSLSVLVFLIKRASLVIANDSGIMHLASYLNIPVVAIFGPTNHQKYGPWSDTSRLIRSAAFCTACEMPRGRLNHECIDSIKTAQVLEAVDSILG